MKTHRQEVWQAAQRLGAIAAVAVRGNYMLGFTGVVLGLAAAASVGAFGGLSGEQRPEEARMSPGAPGVVLSAAPARGPAQPLAMTYLLVDSAEHASMLISIENIIVNREALSVFGFEVLLVRNAEEEAAALRAVEEARRRAPNVRVTVEDLRRR